MERLDHDAIVELGEDGMYDLINELYDVVDALEMQLESAKNGKGRKAEVLEILKTKSPITIVAIAEILNISTKNVSSQLTYLRQEGVNICTDVNGKKFIIEE